MRSLASRRRLPVLFCLAALLWLTSCGKEGEPPSGRAPGDSSQGQMEASSFEQPQSEEEEDNRVIREQLLNLPMEELACCWCIFINDNGYERDGFLLADDAPELLELLAAERWQDTEISAGDLPRDITINFHFFPKEETVKSADRQQDMLLRFQLILVEEGDLAFDGYRVWRDDEHGRIYQLPEGAVAVIRAYLQGKYRKEPF